VLDKDYIIGYTLSMDRDDAFYYLHELEDDVLIEVIDEWKKHKGDENARQAWRVIPSGLLKKEWNYNAETGLVHDKVIDKIVEIIIENYLKLYINTVLFGHTSLSPYAYAECFISEDMTEEDFEEFLEDFEWFACDEKLNWRISDFGIEKLGNCVMAILTEDDYNKKTAYADMALSVVHQRSDLSSWFVEGGYNTLQGLYLGVV